MDNLSFARKYPLRSLALYALAIVSWVFILPGYIAIRERVLTPEQVKEHLQGKPLADWNDYQVKLQAYEKAISQIQGTCRNFDDPKQLPPKPKAPFRISGMTDDWLMEIWSLSYLCLGLLIFQWSSKVESFAWKRIFVSTVVVYALFDWGTYVRNFVLTRSEDGRKLFSFVNKDISSFSWLLQEGRCLVLAFLISCFLDLTSRAIHQVEGASQQSLQGTVTVDVLAETDHANSEFMRMWQFASLLLAVIFIPWTLFYWDHVVNLQDVRYLPAGITIHVIWIVCWFQATRPVLMLLTRWRMLKLMALTTQGANLDVIKSVLEETRTDNEWQLITAGVAAVVSILLPLIKAI
jgi:hypothetical protein